jgi:PAS domain S-box-containing protein
MPGAVSRSGLSLRAYLVLLAGAALLPMSVLAIWLSLTIARDQRVAQHGRMQETAQALAAAVDRDLYDSVHTLEAVAASSSMERPNADALREDLARLVAGQRGWRAVTLETPEGQPVVDTVRPPATAEPSRPERIRQVLDRGAPVVAHDPDTAPDAFVVRVPVMRGGIPRFVLSATVSAESVTTGLIGHGLPPAWSTSLVDARGDVLASLPAAASLARRPRFPFVTGAAAAGWGGRADMPEGPVYFAYARPGLTDWHLVLAAPVTVLDAPWRQTIALLVGAGVAALLGSVALAALVARPIVRSFGALAGASAELRQGRRPRPIGSPVTDVARVSDDLTVAADALESAESAEREWLAQLSALVNQPTVGIAQIDADGRFVLVNRRYCELVGRAPDQVVGHPLEEVLHPEERARFLGLVQALTEGQPERTSETRYRSPTGVDRWIDTSCSLVLPEAPGTAAHGAVSIVALDAGWRRAQREETRAGESRFRAVADAAPMLVWLAAPDGRRTWLNSRWLAFVGQRLEAETGEGWLQHVHADDRSRCREAIAEAFGARRRFAIEYRLGRHDGIDRWVCDDGVPLHDPDGSFTGYVGVCQDITAQRAAERERDDLLAREREARREAEAAGQIKDEFLAALSHELRAPLNAVRIWAGLLKSDLHDPQSLARAADTIDRSAVLQTRLIEELLDEARIVSGRLGLVRERVVLAPVVDAALDSARPPALNKGVVLVRRVDGDGAVVLGDATRLQQVVWNLLANAIRFTPAGGRVEVTLRRKGDRAELTVADSGRGIAPELLPHVFDRFRQGESGTTRSHGGLGLGLSIARQLVELHGGTIEAASPGVGSGATFTVNLPLAGTIESGPGADRSPLPVARPQRGAERALEHVHVLVVDDDTEARDVMALGLGQQGATVTTAPSVAEALVALEREWPDVLVGDIGMPGEDGYDLIRKVRRLEARHGRHIPAIAVTGYAADEDRRRVLEAGYEIYLAKPVPAAVVAPLIRSLVAPHDSRFTG